MKIAYDMEVWERLGAKLPITAPLKTHPSYLLTGSSGSGKSYALKYLMFNASNEARLWVCDFKDSEDFTFLKGLNGYYEGDNAEQGILHFHDAFTKVRKKEIITQEIRILVIDEYPSLLLYLSSIDKEEKTKRADRIKRCVAEMLMLGRGLGFGVWIVTQRADASLFDGGSRDNFMGIISLGRTSREQEQMLFAGEEIQKRIYKPGEGIVLLDGLPLMEIKFPMIKDVKKLEGKIIEGFKKSRG
ncbi:MAG: hypothetical protein K9L62_12850 [Vallitaleaceae bacterium]|nr:hypothetical protein [Vallitaleaceae bacterium]